MEAARREGRTGAEGARSVTSDTDDVARRREEVYSEVSERDEDERTSFGPTRRSRRGSTPGRGIRVLGTAVLLLVAAFLLPMAFGHAAASGGAATPTSDPGCAAAGTTGLTAAVVATPHERISGTIDATGCDIGVYVGPGVFGVKITGATITNANDHGIFVQDTSGTMISGDVVVHNGLASHKCSASVPPPCIPEDKAIELSGTSHVTVRDTMVVGNIADGGIGVSDDGPVDPGAPAAGALRTSSENVLEGNTIANDAFGCGIVLASYDAGAGVRDNLVLHNSVTGSAPGTGPFVGGIVVAADAPGTHVWDNSILFNQVFESVIPGIVVHSNAPGDRVWGNALIGNLLVNNGFQSPPDDPTVPTGIEVVAEGHPGETNAPLLTDTFVLDNTADSDSIGVWLCDETHTVIIGLHGNAITPVESC